MEIPQALIDKTIQRGVILHCSQPDDVDHGKFIVIIGENEKEYVGYFFINSRVNFMFADKTGYMDSQFELKCECYDFLKYTSYLNCADMLQINKKDLLLNIKRKKNQIKGELTQEDLEDILALARESKALSKREKRTFLK